MVKEIRRRIAVGIAYILAVYIGLGMAFRAAGKLAEISRGAKPRERDADAPTSTVKSNSDSSVNIPLVKLDHVDSCPKFKDPTADNCHCEIGGVFSRCVVCRMPFSRSEFESGAFAMGCCPECGTQMIPLHPSGDRVIKIHWSELQLLSAWAEQFAAHHRDQPEMLKAIYSITQELESQYPVSTPLTAGRQLGLMQEKQPGASLEWGLIQPVRAATRLQ